MTHEQLVDLAVRWLRAHYRCSIILSEQACCSGEIPDVIGWKGRCRSVLVECKMSRSDFLADRSKPWRSNPERGPRDARFSRRGVQERGPRDARFSRHGVQDGALGCERYYMAPAGLIAPAELPDGWGLLEVRGRKVEVAVACNKRRSLRTPEGLLNEMNLLLASLRRVEIRIEPQTVTEFLKWENRLARYNGGTLPQGVSDPAEGNGYLRL